MGKNTDKLITVVENHLYLTKRALTDYTEEVRIALKDKEFDTGVSMGALLKRIAEEDPKRAAKIKADADRLWKENAGKIALCVKNTKAELVVLSNYVEKKKNSRKLPWDSKSTTKAITFIKETGKFLDSIPTVIVGLKEKMNEASQEIAKISSQFGRFHTQAANLKKETKDQNDEQS